MEHIPKMIPHFKIFALLLFIAVLSRFCGGAAVSPRCTTDTDCICGDNATGTCENGSCRYGDECTIGTTVSEGTELPSCDNGTECNNHACHTASDCSVSESSFSSRVVVKSVECIDGRCLIDLLLLECVEDSDCVIKDDAAGVQCYQGKCAYMYANIIRTQVRSGFVQTPFGLRPNEDDEDE